MADNRTFYWMARGWRDHVFFEGETYSRMDAWGWLIENALWRDGVVNVNKSPVPLKRGQLAYSIRYLGVKWGWAKTNVERFLKHLKKWDMVQCETGTGFSIITICNYDVYQPGRGSDRDTSGTQTGTEAGQRRDRGGTNKKKEKKENTEKEVYPPLTPHARGAVCAPPVTMPRITTLAELRAHSLNGPIEKYFTEHFPAVNRFALRDSLLDWCEAKGKTYKDYCAALRQWARTEHKKLNEKSPIQKPLPQF